MIANGFFAIPSGAESHFVTFGGNRIHYATIGQGARAFVFVHGWACHLGFWGGQVPALANHGKLVLIDLPGHGKSDKPETTYSMDFFAEAILAVLKDAAVDHATFIGHSMGAAVLCRVHHHAPEKFDGLVSVDGLLCKLPEKPETVRVLLGGLASPHYQAAARAFISSFFPIPGTEALRDCVTAEMLGTPQHVMLSAMTSMIHPQRPDWLLEKVNAPVIVLNAATDWWNADYEKYVHSLSPHSGYLALEGVGHFLMLEQSARFNALLAEKLGKCGLIAG